MFARGRRENSPLDCFLILLHPRCTLRQTRRLGPPCLRAFHAPSPSTLIPVLSIKRCSGPCDPRRDVHGKGLLATAQRAEVRHLPVQSDQAKQALDEARRLPRRHRARTDGASMSTMPNRTFIVRQVCTAFVAVNRLSSTFASGRSIPTHLRVKPDRQRAAALQRLVVSWPVLGLVTRYVRSAHPPQLSRWIHEMNSLRPFVQQSRPQGPVHFGILQKVYDFIELAWARSHANSR